MTASLHGVLSVLVVDDDIDTPVGGGASMRDNLEAIRREEPGLCVHYAQGLAEGSKILRETYVDAILVDHELGSGKWGCELLAAARVMRPSCLRIIMTSKPEFRRKGSEYLFRCFALADTLLGEPLANRFVPRHIVQLDRYVRFLFREFALPNLKILFQAHDVGENYPTLGIFETHVLPRLRRSYQGSATPTVEEFEHVLRAVCSGTPVPGTMSEEPVWQRHHSEELVTHLSLSLLTGGRSSATVMACVPITEGKHKCALCVIKVAPRQDTLEEVARYNQYVRLHRAAARRIELLGACVADTLGAACYSFAGGGVDSVRVLEDLLVEQDHKAFVYLDHEFSYVNKEWYSGVRVTTENTSIMEFFDVTYDLRAAEVLQKVLLRVSESAVPLEDLSAPEIAAKLNQMSYASCIVHGDLNAGNILCSNVDEAETNTTIGCTNDRTQGSTRAPELTEPFLDIRRRTILIDYRHTCRGPVFTDFAALQVSVRLLPTEIEKAELESSTLIEWENSVWLQAWNTPMDPANLECPETLDYSGKIAVRIAQLARKNFEMNGSHGSGQLSHGRAQCEYAATCLLYALRVLRIKRLGQDIIKDANGDYRDVGDSCRLRLGIWVYQLAAVLANNGLAAN